MRILYIAPLLPASSGSGGKRAVYNHLEDMLGDDALVDAFFVDVEGEAAPDLGAFARFSPRVFGRALPKFGDGIQGKVRAVGALLLNPLPRSIAVVASADARQALRRQLGERPYDAIVIDHLNAYGIVRGLAPQVPLVYVAHNVESEVLRHGLERLPRFSARRAAAALDLMRMRRVERELLAVASRVIVIGAGDAALGEMRAAGSRLAIWPELPRPKPRQWTHPGAKNLLFVGSAKYFPNKEAIEWLAGSLVPALLQADPGIVLHVAGSNAGELGYGANPPGVAFHGFVSDARLDELHREATLFICPVVLGAGIKIKLLEAASYGMPTTATAESLAGIDFLHGISLDIERRAAVDAANRIAALINQPAQLAAMAEATAAALAGTLATRVSLLDHVRAALAGASAGPGSIDASTASRHENV
jgi:glycosyltransferase involved in cell wall biosynthesis